MSVNATEKLIQLALYETGSYVKGETISKTNCNNVCTKLYDFAKEDGHAIMNTSKYVCTCDDKTAHNMKK